MNLFSIFAISIIIFSALPAWADGLPDGLYVSGSYGAAFFNSAKDGSPVGDKTLFNDGYGGSMALGYSFPEHFRLEGEIGYHKAGAKESRDSYPCCGPYPENGFSAATSYMANAYYDIPTGTRLTPYIGGGLGVISLDYKLIESGSYVATTDNTSQDTQFGYQLMAGAAYQVTDAMAFTLGYRYQASTDPSFRDGMIYPEAGLPASFRSQYSSNSVEAGIRYSLAPAAPVETTGWLDEMPVSNWYVAGNYGAAFFNPSKNRITSSEAIPGDAAGGFTYPPLFSTFRNNYDQGYAASGAIGYSLPYNFRVEGELGYRKANIKETGYPGYSYDIANTGFAAATSYMANIYYDIATGTAVTPYLGGGIGAINFHDKSSAGETSDIVLGYQLMAGAAYKLTERLDFTLGYRYQGSQSPLVSKTSEIFTAPETPEETITPVSGKYRSEYASNSIEAGLRYRF